MALIVLSLYKINWTLALSISLRPSLPCRLLHHCCPCQRSVQPSMTTRVRPHPRRAPSSASSALAVAAALAVCIDHGRPGTVLIYNTQRRPDALAHPNPAAPSKQRPWCRQIRSHGAPSSRAAGMRCNTHILHKVMRSCHSKVRICLFLYSFTLDVASTVILSKVQLC
jgi:hypothetical protein